MGDRPKLSEVRYQLRAPPAFATSSACKATLTWTDAAERIAAQCPAPEPEGRAARCPVTRAEAPQGMPSNACRPHGDASTIAGSPSAAGSTKIRLWLGAVQLQMSLPAEEALQEMLYGDPGNSARDSDIIALLYTGLPNFEERLDCMRRLLENSVEDSQNYIFNSNCKGTEVPGVPARLSPSGQESGTQVFVGMHVAVHKRVCSKASCTTGMVFPVVPTLYCCAGARSIMIQEVRVQGCQVALCGADLSEDAIEQQEQLEQLGHLLRWRAEGGHAFSAILFGNIQSDLVHGEDFGVHMESVTGAEDYATERISDLGIDELLRRIRDVEMSLPRKPEDHLASSRAKDPPTDGIGVYKHGIKTTSKILATGIAPNTHGGRTYRGLVEISLQT